MNYNTTDKEKKVFVVIMAFIVLMILALIVLELCGMFDEPLWKPDAVFPMANANVSWLQSFYGGAMSL